MEPQKDRVNAGCRFSLGGFRGGRGRGGLGERRGLSTEVGRGGRDTEVGRGGTGRARGGWRIVGERGESDEKGKAVVDRTRMEAGTERRIVVNGRTQEQRNKYYKKNKAKKRKKPVETFKCDVCHITLIGKATWNSHCAGRKHKNKLRGAFVHLKNQVLRYEESMERVGLDCEGIHEDVTDRIEMASSAPNVSGSEVQVLSRRDSKSLTFSNTCSGDRGADRAFTTTIEERPSLHNNYSPPNIITDDTRDSSAKKDGQGISEDRVTTGESKTCDSEDDDIVVVSEKICSFSMFRKKGTWSKSVARGSSEDFPEIKAVTCSNNESDSVDVSEKYGERDKISNKKGYLSNSKGNSPLTNNKSRTSAEIEVGDSVKFLEGSMTEGTEVRKGFTKSTDKAQFQGMLLSDKVVGMDDDRRVAGEAEDRNKFERKDRIEASLSGNMTSDADLVKRRTLGSEVVSGDNQLNWMHEKQELAESESSPRPHKPSTIIVSLPTGHEERNAHTENTKQGNEQEKARKSRLSAIVEAKAASSERLSFASLSWECPRSGNGMEPPPIPPYRRAALGSNRNSIALSPTSQKYAVAPKAKQLDATKAQETVECVLGFPPPRYANVYIRGHPENQIVIPADAELEDETEDEAENEPEQCTGEEFCWTKEEALRFWLELARWSRGSKVTRAVFRAMEHLILNPYEGIPELKDIEALNKALCKVPMKWEKGEDWNVTVDCGKVEKILGDPDAGIPPVSDDLNPAVEALHEQIRRLLFAGGEDESAARRQIIRNDCLSVQRGEITMPPASARRPVVFDMEYCYDRKLQCPEFFKPKEAAQNISRTKLLPTPISQTPVPSITRSNSSPDLGAGIRMKESSRSFHVNDDHYVAKFGNRDFPQVYSRRHPLQYALEGTPGAWSFAWPSTDPSDEQRMAFRIGEDRAETGSRLVRDTVPLQSFGQNNEQVQSLPECILSRAPSSSRAGTEHRFLSRDTSSTFQGARMRRRYRSRSEANDQVPSPHNRGQSPLHPNGRFRGRARSLPRGHGMSRPSENSLPPFSPSTNRAPLQNDMVQNSRHVRQETASEPRPQDNRLSFDTHRIHTSNIERRIPLRESEWQCSGYRGEERWPYSSQSLSGRRVDMEQNRDPLFGRESQGEWTRIEGGGWKRRELEEGEIWTG